LIKNPDKKKKKKKKKEKKMSERERERERGGRCIVRNLSGRRRNNV
jgi:hypothetical protein